MDKVSKSKAKAVDYLFYSHPVSVKDLTPSELTETSFTISLPYGIQECQQWCFEGIRIRHTKNQFKDHYCFENKNNLDAVSLEFNLKGQYEIHHLDHVYQVNSRQHNIIYSPAVHNTFLNRDLQGETFLIQFLPEVFFRIVKESNVTLKRFAEKTMEGKPGVIAQVSPLLTSELLRPIQEIIHCRFTGGLKKVFLLSKCMEILVIQAEAFDKAEKMQNQRSKNQDEKDRIHYAKEFLIQNIDNPPSLSELSKIVGLNEYKLKKDFKEIFHTTAFGYLSDYRLEKARKALLDNHQSISEIAYDLGYSSPQHFSSAFKKKFGVSPKSVKKLS